MWFNVTRQSDFLNKPKIKEKETTSKKAKSKNGSVHSDVLNSVKTKKYGKRFV